MSETSQASAPPQPGIITKDHVLAGVLESYPQTMGVLLQFGLAPSQRPVAEQSTSSNATIEQAARTVGADLESLLAALNRIRAAVDASGSSTVVSLPITRNHLVGEVTEAFPATLDVFLKNGFAHLADESMRRTVAKTVTIEMATRIHGIDLDTFLADLNKAAGNS